MKIEGAKIECKHFVNSKVIQQKLSFKINYKYFNILKNILIYYTYLITSDNI